MTRELISVTNTTVVNTETMCQLLRKIAASGLAGPITLVLDNARYQRNAVVQALAAQLGITLLYLPSYSPNLNLIERLWKFIKRHALYGRYHPTFADFQAAIQQTLDGLPTTYAEQLKTLMTLKFQTFDLTQVGGVLGRGLVPQRTVRSFAIIFPLPARTLRRPDLRSRTLQGSETRHATYCGTTPRSCSARRSPGHVQRPRARALQPRPDRLGREFRAVVAADPIGGPPPGPRPGPGSPDLLGGHAPPCLQCQAFTCTHRRAQPFELRRSLSGRN